MVDREQLREGTYCPLPPFSFRPPSHIYSPLATLVANNKFLFFISQRLYSVAKQHTASEVSPAIHTDNVAMASDEALGRYDYSMEVPTDISPVKALCGKADVNQ